MSVADAASYLDTSEDGIHALVRARAIPHRRQGRRLLFRQCDLDAWFQALPGVSVDEAVKRLSHVDDAVNSAETTNGHRRPQHTAVNGSQESPVQLVRRPQRAKLKYPGKA